MCRSRGWLTFALTASLLGAGCEQKTPSENRGDGGAAADKYANADPKLEKALKAAASAAGNSDQGPPPAGIFAPGGAEQRHPKGTPTKVDFVSDGSEPRVALGAGADAASDAPRSAVYGPALLELMVQGGPRSAPLVVDLSLVVTPAKKDEGGTDWIVATVKKAAPVKDPSLQLAPGADKQIATLQGTRLLVQVSPDGLSGDIQVQLDKAAAAELDQVARAAIDALVMAIVPLPSRPVGAGATWIAETRMRWGGSDVIAYRAFRVKSVEGNRVHLSVSVKAYATQKEPQLDGLPKGATLVQFEGEAQGEVELARGEILPRRSNVQHRIAMILSQNGSPPPEPDQPPEAMRGGMLSAQIQGQAVLIRGEDLRAASRP